MFNLLVADDEQLERDAIAFLIRKKNLPFNVIKAKNGKEAISLFKENTVDFVILDIKMPLIDGIEAGTKIREINNKIPIVYLTAWSSFDFAKSAISIGAIEYLVKPLNKTELYKVLDSFIEQKEKETSDKNEELKTVINQFSRSFFASMKHNLVQTDILRKYFNINENSFYEGVALVVSEVKTNNLKKFFGQKEFLNCRFYYFPTADRTTIIAFPRNKKAFFSKLNNSLTMNRFIVAIGSVFTSLDQLSKSIEEASIAYSIAKSNNEKIHEFNQLDEIQITKSDTNYVIEIKKAIDDTNLTKAREIAHNLYDSLIVLDPITRLDTYYHNVLVLNHEIATDIPFFKMQLPQKTMVEIEIFFYNLIDNAIKAIKSDKKDKYSRIFKQIKKEIELNHSKQLTMDYYSSLLNMNTKYFSKLFKDYNKISFCDCLTNIRMEKAKELLKKGVPVKECATKVGYIDSAYFSKVFSQKYKINPSVFKTTYEQ
ncbi:MAG: response regulator [Sphaerochaetaceae bacterium]|nr:response regulator [Sphaerochaetaceae bacterium]MDC7250080.1 response regulator [Sphaerochaetaceae bacterium]